MRQINHFRYAHRVQYDCLQPPNLSNTLGILLEWHLSRIKQASLFSLGLITLVAGGTYIVNLVKHLHHLCLSFCCAYLSTSSLHFDHRCRYKKWSIEKTLAWRFFWCHSTQHEHRPYLPWSFYQTALRGPLDREYHWSLIHVLRMEFQSSLRIVLPISTVLVHKLIHFQYSCLLPFNCAMHAVTFVLGMSNN